MSFQWVGRTDDTHAWTWDSTKIKGDNFRRSYSAVEKGGVKGETYPIKSGQSFSKGDLLYLSSDELAVHSSVGSNTFEGVAMHDSGALEWESEATIAELTLTALFATTDVNGTAPTTAHIASEAALDLTGGEWTIDVTGIDAVYIEDVDIDRGWYIIRFLAAVIT